MRVHLVNPSDNSFGTAVITPRWLFVLAAATPKSAGDPILIDESLDKIVRESIRPEMLSVSACTGNALRGYQVGRMARERGAWVVYAGIHATLFPEETLERGAAHAVVKGDGDVVWGTVVRDCLAGKSGGISEGGRIAGADFLPARWELIQPDKYMWASVQTIRECPKHCSFCSVWRTDGQQPRQRQYQKVIDEIITLRRLGFRFIALADDNFYPVTLADLRLAREQNNAAKVEELTAVRAELCQRHSFDPPILTSRNRPSRSYISSHLRGRFCAKNPSKSLVLLGFSLSKDVQEVQGSAVLVAPQGFEPRLIGSEPTVLPLNEGAAAGRRSPSSRDRTPSLTTF